MRVLAMLAMAISLSGCAVPIPLLPIDYTPAATIQSASIPEKEVDRTLVSIGPRDFLDNLTRRIAKENARLAAVDRLAVRDALFPQGGWRLSALLATAPSDAVRDQVDYLVLVREPVTQSLALEGERGDLSAFVLDVSTRAFPTGYRAESETSPMKSLLFEPKTKKSLNRGIAHAVAEYMLRAHPDGTVRFVVMAAEMPSEPVWQLLSEQDGPGADR